MKNGIITFHRTSNFGSCLQAYALCKKITDLGYECELIDYHCPAIESREGINIRKKSASLKGKLIDCLQRPKIIEKYNNLMSFLTGNIKLSEEYTPETVKDANGKYSKFIVGSDIVWGTDITEGDYNYFLDFVEDNDKKFAFSSSVGDCERFGGDEKNKVTSLLDSFSHIAVREADAADWIEKNTNQKVDFVCDPTMLLTAREWDAAVNPKVYKSDYVLVYFTDTKGKTIRDAVSYAQKRGLKVYYVSNSIKPVKNVKIIKPTSLEEFLGLIKNADTVFTASYHGMLFSAYYHKDFLFYTRAHSSRVLSLAKRLGMEDRCADEMDIEKMSSPDYAQIDIRIDVFREESIKVLREMLER